MKRKLIFTRGGFGVAKISRYGIKKNFKVLMYIAKESLRFKKEEDSEKRKDKNDEN